MVSDPAYSPELRDFVSQCLQKSPAARPQADELLNHPFITMVSGMAKEEGGQDQGLMVGDVLSQFLQTSLTARPQADELLNHPFITMVSGMGS